MFEAMFAANVKELRSLFLATKGVEHNGEKGSLREAFVISLLQQYLPVQFGIGSGVVVDKQGRQSPQIDIVIYDKRTMPPILDKSGRGIYPIDAVLRVIEVKSVLDTSALSQLTKIINSFDPNNQDGLKMASKGKLPKGRSLYPVCAMFAFDSKIANLGDHCFNNKNLHNSLIYTDNGHLWGVKMTSPNAKRLPFQGKYMKFADENYGLRIFIGLLFDQIETTAKSRSDYSPLDWMKGAS